MRNFKVILDNGIETHIEGCSLFDIVTQIEEDMRACNMPFGDATRIVSIEEE